MLLDVRNGANLDLSGLPRQRVLQNAVKKSVHVKLVADLALRHQNVAIQYDPSKIRTKSVVCEVKYQFLAIK